MADELLMMLARSYPKSPKLLLIIAALLVVGADVANAQMPRFEIEVNDTPTPDDDYFCWTPIPARIRMIGGAMSVTVIVNNRHKDGGGEVVFQAHNGARPKAADFTPAVSVELRLAASEDWTPFWIAGSKASTNRKDTEIVVTQAGNDAEVAAIPVMVRVRKDAATLNAEEVRRFLSALRSHHDVENGGLASKYIKYADAHDLAFLLGIHRGLSRLYLPLFLAWHRAFLLSIERELQAIDRSIALPYWRFDRNDPAEGSSQTKIFAPEFMGTVSGTARVDVSFLVRFSNDNPLFGWSDPNAGALVRGKDGTPAPIPATRLSALFTQRSTSGDLIYGAYKDVNRILELRYHNGAHRHISGWLMRRDSPMDPLFYLLHGNVDRAWALWQDQNPTVRFNANLRDAYHAQGKYPGPVAGQNRFRKGSYSDDVMWPWEERSGNERNDDAMDDWPDINFEMPIGAGIGGPSNRPTPASMIDYMDRRGRGTGIGACYDHIEFQ